MLGSDATILRLGQLVLVDINVRARDDNSLNILQGLFATGPAGKLMDEEWRHGSYAEYLKAPLENIFPLDEDILIKQMGYTIHDLCYITTLMVPMGGLVDLGIKPGQSVVVAPATGAFGGAAVTVALAMGARVVAAGRNEAQLKAMESVLGTIYGGRLASVKLTGSVDADAQALQKASPGGKGLDAYIDFSPATAAKSTHIKSCIIALKTHGKASFMGGIQEDVNIPYNLLMLKSLQIKGRFMYERQAIVQLIGMVEAGIVKLGKAADVEIVGAYKLEDIEAALDAAAKNSGFGKEVVLAP
jgi:D-arabinose 1-dehydrogenase-like Zn-dependent alcohol dehydrogenase